MIVGEYKHARDDPSYSTISTHIVHVCFRDPVMPKVCYACLSLTRNKRLLVSQAFSFISTCIITCEIESLWCGCCTGVVKLTNKLNNTPFDASDEEVFQVGLAYLTSRLDFLVSSVLLG